MNPKPATPPIRLALPASALALLLIFSGTTVRAKKDHSLTAPGKYEDWNDIVNSLEIKESFKLGDYSSVVVTPVETAKTPLPDKDDNTYEPTLNVLKKVTGTLIEGMRDELKSPPVAAGDAPAPAPAAAPAANSAAGSAAAPAAALKVLVVRLRIVALNPGSRAARYWGGFGAGKSSVELAGEVADGASGRVLLVFSLTRASSGTWKMAGGDYEKMMTGDIEDAGSDVGTMLAAFK
jgi:hypothetical protein